MTEAQSLLNDALRADPDHPMGLTQRAENLILRRQQAEAIELLDKMLASNPNFAPAWNQYSKACWLSGWHGRSLDAARMAVNIQPPNPLYRLQLAQVAAWSGYHQEAADTLQPLLQHDDPDVVANARAMMGERAVAAGQFLDANPYLIKALDQIPGLLAARMMLGMNQLRLGDYECGWINYAARETIPFLYPDGPPALPGKVWKGEDLTSKTLLVHDDQGHGDAIQFVRYLRDPHPMGAKQVALLTVPGLVRLMAGSLPHLQVMCALPQGTHFDYQTNSTAVPACFGARLHNIPASRAYLQAPSQVIAPLRLPSEKRLKIGVAWSGDTRHTRDLLRSIPAEDFLRLADLPGISFYSLQHEVRPSDLPALEARPRIDRQIERAIDFADTAAFIDKLDLVVTVDTAVAHLAAALGKPVWIILHVSPDWRWMAEREDSPWYPTVRLFRVRPDEWKPGEGGWDGVLQRVAAALRRQARKR